MLRARTRTSAATTIGGYLLALPFVAILHPLPFGSLATASVDAIGGDIRASTTATTSGSSALRMVTF
jgi:hypothetical protein